MKSILCVLILLSTVTVTNAASLEACRVREYIQLDMDVIASNIANVNTTRTPEGGPYQKKSLFCDNHLCEIVSSQASLLRYEPNSPDADDSGYVKYPDIDLMEELSAMIEATRAYDAVDKNCN
ncbi:MAG: flagellar basal body rod protein FlgC [Bdellovibrio sp.]